MVLFVNYSGNAINSAFSTLHSTTGRKISCENEEKTTSVCGVFARQSFQNDDELLGESVLIARGDQVIPDAFHICSAVSGLLSVTVDANNQTFSSLGDGDTSSAFFGLDL